MTVFPTFQFEKELWSKGYTVIGIDEVGRGAFAGPVYATAFSFNPVFDPDELIRITTLGINDSKKLLPHKRQSLSALLHQESAVFATISRDCETINTHGIIKALNFAIQEAIEQVCEKMPHKKFFFLMDGAYLPSILSLTNKNSRCIIKGDGLSLSIAAASILAKVERDTYMDILAKDFPQYQWAQNKGYGTRTHREAITKYGACDHHRALYLRKLLGTTNADHRDTSDVPQKVLSSV